MAGKRAPLITILCEECYDSMENVVVVDIFSSSSPARTIVAFWFWYDGMAGDYGMGRRERIEAAMFF